MTVRSFFAVVLLSSCVLAIRADVLRVRSGALPGGDGSSWPNAIDDLQLAISAATSGDEIWVARGVYKPTTDNVRAVSFALKGGLEIYGGFAGTETQRNQRNREARTNGTILSGDIDGNDVNTDGNFVAEHALEIQGLNSFHVVTISNVSAVVLDGFTITGGQANGSGGDAEGGGLRCSSFNGVRLANLLFSGNVGQLGGGLYCMQGELLLVRSTFVGNSAASRGGAAWMANVDGTVIQSRLTGNSAVNEGGGIFFDEGDMFFTQVLFAGNAAGTSGGALHADDGHPFLSHSVFAGNSAGVMGAAIGGLERVILQNSIVWSNTPVNPVDALSWDASHCVIEGGHPFGMNIISDDPLLVRLPDPGNNDFGDLRLLLGSPAINTGNNDFLPMDLGDLDDDGQTAEPLPVDFAGRTRVLNGTVDIGAFEGGYATFSHLYPTLSPEADANVNGFANIAEYGFVTDPTIAGNLSNRPRLVQTDDTLSLEYTRRANAADLDFALVRSPDLLNWMRAEEGADYETLTSVLSGQDADALHVVLRILNDAPEEFWRLDIHPGSNP